MSRRALTLALVAAFLIPTLLLAWIGLGSLRQEAERTSARYSEQAEALGQTVRLELERLLSELRAGRGPIEPLVLRYGSDGTWLGETLESKRADAPADPALAAELAGEIDRLQAKGDLKGAVERTREIAAKSDSASLSAWALEACAALLDQLNLRTDARAAREELIARFGAERDSRGLLRSLVARRSLLASEVEPTDALLALCGDAAADYSALSETASAEFLRQLRADLGERIGSSDEVQLAELERIDRLDAARARLRIWLASSREGPADWVARGAPGSAAIFVATAPLIPSANPSSMEAPIESTLAGDGVFLAAIERQGDEWCGGAMELDRAFVRALSVSAQDAAVRSLGFVATIESRAGSAAATVARLDLGPPLGDFAIAVRGGDLEAFAAGERKRFALLGGLIALAILTAVIGAWLTLRAVSREVEAARGREAFVAAVTHELKTPLAAIRLFAEMLERGDVESPKVIEFGTRTVREADRLARLVDSVLDLARIEHSGTVLAGQPVELRKVAVAAIAIVGNYGRESGFEIELAVGGEGLAIRGDVDALTRAVVNLLENAIKYSERGQPIEVTLAQREDGDVEIAVLDRGRGVPEADRQRIFEAFQRLGSEMTRDRPGVGLGLALVKKIAAAHGGRALCEGRAGGGSRFVLILPMAAKVQP